MVCTRFDKEIERGWDEMVLPESGENDSVRLEHETAFLRFGGVVEKYA